MVKVRGPMFSLDAAGKFGHVVFQHNIFGVYVRRKELFRKTNTLPQVVQNAEYSMAIDDWRTSTQSIKNIYREVARDMKLGPFQAFVKVWFSLHYNAVYGYGRYGHTLYGEYHGTELKQVDKFIDI
jgi:hypothetical protein